MVIGGIGRCAAWRREGKYWPVSAAGAISERLAPLL